MYQLCALGFLPGSWPGSLQSRSACGYTNGQDYNGRAATMNTIASGSLMRSCVPTVGQWVTSGVPRLSSGKKEAWLSQLAGRRCGSGVCLLAAQSAPLPLSLHRRPRHNFLTYGVCWRPDRRSHPQRRVPTCTCLVRTGQE